MNASLAFEKNQLANLYQEVAGIFGGQANMSYSSDWDRLINGFEAANPDRNIRRVNITKAVLTAPMSYEYGDESGLGEFTGVAWSTLNINNTTTEYNFVEGPEGLTEQVAGAPRLDGWADSFQGSFGLLLPNSCLMQKGAEGLAGTALKETYENNFNQYISPSVSFDYDVRADFGYKATYNKSDVLKIIQRVTRNRGFFSSKSKNEVTEEFESSSSFVVQDITDARGAPVSAEDKAALTQHVRARVVREVLDSVARRKYVTDPAQVTLPPVSDPRAGVFASRLLNTCAYGWGYSCAGGWALYAADSLFGGNSQSVALYIRNNDYSSSEIRTDHFFVEVQGAIGFKN